MEYKQQKQDAEGSDYSFDKQLSAEDKKNIDWRAPERVLFLCLIQTKLE